MSELGPRALSALEELQKQTASGDERERVRARLLGLGVAVSAGGASLLAGSAAASVAGGSLASGLSSAPAAQVALAAGVGGGGGLGASAVGTTIAPTAVGTASAAGGVLSGLTVKLAALPLALKLSVLMVGVGGAVSAPYLAAPRDTERTVQAVTPVAARSTSHSGQPTPASRPDARALPATLARPEAAQAPATAPRETPAPLGTPGRSLRAREPAVAGERATASELQQTASSLAAESALLSDALRALRSGDLAGAQTLLSEHERSFADQALLARERERMRLQLLEARGATREP